MFVLYGDAIFFAILAWYFDNVISSNRGRGDSLLFPIHRLINLFKSKNKIRKNAFELKGIAIGVGE